MATQSDLATHLDLSQQAVSKLKNSGIITAGAGRSGYDLNACRVAYIRHLRQSAAGRDSARAGSLEAERARLAAAQAEAQERKNAHDRGEVLSRAAVLGSVVELVTLTMTRMERVAVTVAGNDLALRRRIEAAVADAMRELSGTDPVDFIAGTGGFDMGNEGNSHEE